MEVRAVSGEDEMRGALVLRHDVFIDEQGVTRDEELDGLDDEAEHLVAVEDGRVLATCRLLHADGTTKLGRMAVERPARGRGIAGLLLELAKARARAAGTQRIVLDAQLTAIPVYERAGYVPEGDVFLDARIEHQRMVLTLA
jgi:predicted GNAT family N-acyltransferase